MTRGHGSLLVVTPAGTQIAACAPSSAPRSVAPTRWAHASACAWVSAWLHLRGRAWYSEREVFADDFWRQELRYQDHRGTARLTHRPDLGVQTASGPVAIEVELQRKNPARLRGICALYARLTEDADAPLAGVIYVTDRDDVSDPLLRAASAVGLEQPAFSLRTLADVIAQTRAAARAGGQATDGAAR
jgi:hypothetical protein